jgi:hypothetical protein
MLWAAIAPVLLSVIQSIALETSDPLWSVEWARQQRAFGSPTVQAGVYLKITSSRPVFDEVRFKFHAPSNTVKDVIHGMRDFTLNVQCKSYSHAYADWAHEYAERIRTRMNRNAVRNSLIAVNTVFLEAGVITDVNGEEDGRELSLANLDLFFRAGFEDEPATGLNWIEKLELTSHLKSPDGVELPHPPNLTEALLPPP